MKNFSTIFIVLFSILIIAAAVRGCMKETANKTALKSLQDIINQRDAEIVTYKDQNGTLHSKIETLYTDKDLLEAIVEKDAALLKIKPKQIQGKSTHTALLDTSFIFDTAYIDNYIQITKKGDTVHLSVNDTITYIDYWKRKWFLGNKHYYLDISHKNPYIKIKDVTSIKLKVKPPMFIIGPSIQYDPFSNRITPGVSILIYPLSIKF